MSGVTWQPHGERGWRAGTSRDEMEEPVHEAGVGAADVTPEEEAREVSEPRIETGAAAFFDFDHTLLDGDAGVVFGRSMMSWTIEQARDLPSPVAKAAFYARLSGIYAGMAAQGAGLGLLNAARIVKRSSLIREVYRFFEGLPVDPTLEKMGAAFEERIAERIFPEMRDLVHQHRDRGHRVVIVTTGPKVLVGHARGYLGEDVDILGVELHQENGRFTGEITGPLWGLEKADMVRAYAKEHALDLTRSYAYTDHHSDLHFLEVVGNPICVNPTPRLRRIAHRRGWLVLEPTSPVPRWWKAEEDETG